VEPVVKSDNDANLYKTLCSPKDHSLSGQFLRGKLYLNVGINYT
jgi:hypothetical protein